MAADSMFKREREYVQLHRDTTVQTLTLAPSLRGGVIVWEDSPFVRAMKHGRVLMVDEVDKAPVEVVCILKALLEDGEILLADGTRYVSERSKFSSVSNGQNGNIIRVHKDFRVIALANVCSSHLRA